MGRKTEIEALERAYPGAQSFVFGDSRDLSEALLALVRAGRKRATCAALSEYDADGVPLPEVGRRDIAVDWSGRPALVIETVEVTLARFCDVDAAFARDEGEDETLEAWRASHRQYFERNGGFDAAMMLVCERFRVVQDLAVPDGGGSG